VIVQLRTGVVVLSDACPAEQEIRIPAALCAAFATRGPDSGSGPLSSKEYKPIPLLLDLQKERIIGAVALHQDDIIAQADAAGATTFERRRSRGRKN